MASCCCCLLPQRKKSKHATPRLGVSVCVKLHTHLLHAGDVGRSLDSATEVSNCAYVVIEGQHSISSQVGEASSHSDHHGGLVSTTRHTGTRCFRNVFCRFFHGVGGGLEKSICNLRSPNPAHPATHHQSVYISTGSGVCS